MFTEPGFEQERHGVRHPGLVLFLVGKRGEPIPIKRPGAIRARGRKESRRAVTDGGNQLVIILQAIENRPEFRRVGQVLHGAMPPTRKMASYEST